MFKKIALAMALIVSPAVAQESWQSQLTAEPRVKFCGTVDLIFGNLEKEGFKKIAYGYVQDDAENKIMRLTTMWVHGGEGILAVTETDHTTKTCLITSTLNFTVIDRRK